MEVDILFLSHADLFYSWLDGFYPSKQLSFLVILGVFEDASGKFHAIDTVGLLIGLEALELKQIKFLHDLPLELEHFGEGVCLLPSEHALG